ncbi:4-hydroxybenzoyl-CoA thioesterase [Arenicella chitinivorans]|uniref:4-hydroxybenzoyl-CoA thioesterase n=1 Tax=Arenicella chitinivorans TaxID=1329800 RepID=A0A918RGN9_9GAMM|nr:thioesterase family protein [Arenicella chitinivorans]GGZ98167.1 4-hydroxybenzoyl-CoA thioesterase [Arenicella chitinivorans]
MQQPFTHYLRVRYAECDAQGVVFNARYGEYVDVAATEFSRAVWGNYQDLLARGLDTQVVKLTTTWVAPARFDDVLAIDVALAHLGRSSYQLTLTHRCHPTGKHIATSEITYVMVDSGAYQSTPIPDDLRQRLTDAGAGQVSNHAGVELPG